MDFKQGDVVTYGTHGACTITFIGDVEINREMREYYVLEPCNNTPSKYYVPKNNASAVTKIKKLLSPSQLEELLTAVVGKDDNWIENEPLRKEHYKELLSSGDCEDIICMIRTLHHHRKKQLSLGKKVHICDENFIKTAEQLISSEVAQILNIPQEEVGEYIRSKLAD